MPEESKTLLPSQSIATDGKYLKSDGDKASWQDSDAGAMVSAHNTSETAHDDIREQLSAKADVVQEDWITPTLLNGWTQFGESDPVGIMKDNMGFVHLRGAITGGVYPSVCFALPIGYRPANTNTRIPAAGGGYSRVTIGSAVQATAGTDWISLDGITFRAEV